MAATTLLLPTMLLVFLLISTGCDAFVPSKSLFNLTSGLGQGRFIGDDIETEFLMESHVSRILAEDTLRFETMRTPNANIASAVDCERPPRYDSCLGEKKNNAPSENCDPFNRANPC